MIKCNCPCHTNPDYKHIQSCCENGWIKVSGRLKISSDNSKKKTFGQNLKELRRAKDKSQRQLANHLGKEFAFVSKLENDRIERPANDILLQICDCLEINLSDLNNFKK